MSRFSNPLSNVKVASPCPADWNRMIGDERVRFCGQCQLNVYNLSAMTRDQAESVIAGTEGRLCVRFYRRKDGSILTQDCPVGLRAIRQRASRIRRAVLSALFGFLAGIGGTTAVNRIGEFLLGTDNTWGHVQGVMVERHTPRLDDVVGRMVVERPDEVRKAKRNARRPRR
jgi:hypothetical protein